MSCSADEDYMGCYSMENFAASSQFSLNTTVNCKLKCLKENARFFGEYSKKDNSKYMNSMTQYEIYSNSAPWNWFDNWVFLLGLSGDTCFCGDVLNGPGVVNATHCSTACTDKKEWKPYFCGGPDNLVSVFTTS